MQAQAQEQSGKQRSIIKLNCNDFQQALCLYQKLFMTFDIKRRLLDYIDLIEDESALQLLNEAAEVYITRRPDILDILTDEIDYLLSNWSDKVALNFIDIVEKKSP